MSQLRAYTLLSAAYYQQGCIEQMGQTVKPGLLIAAHYPQANETAYFYIQAALYQVSIGDHAQSRGLAEQANTLLLAAGDLWGASKALYTSAVVDGMAQVAHYCLFLA